MVALVAISALGIGATSFASTSKDTADSPAQRETPKDANHKDTIWQYNLPWTDGWKDYIRFDPNNFTTYQPYDKFKEYIESKGGQVRIKP